MVGMSLEARRQQNRTAALRPTCARCGRPESGCYCAHLSRIDTRTRVVLLQHPREQDVAIGTARMASLCLTNAQLLVGVDFEGSTELQAALQNPAAPPILLYPGEASIDIAKHPPPGPVTLVVVDGTWSQTKKLVRRNPLLSSLPRYAFVPPRPSEYRIRREPHETCVATIEALVHTLTALEGDGARFDQMLAPFRAMIDFQISCQDRLHGARLRHPKTPRVEAPRTAPAWLDERREDLVCVVGEANAWPYALRSRDPSYEDEIIQWAAFRPATGETFSALAAPRRELSPHTALHAGLSEDAIRAGAALGSLHERWRAFVRDSDVVCSWGRYETSLFTASGAYLPPARSDLRQIARTLANGKVGTLEQYVSELGVLASPEAPLVPGRAGKRLGAVARVLGDYLTDLAAQRPPTT